MTKKKTTKKPIKVIRTVPIRLALRDKGNQTRILKYMRAKGTTCVECGAVAIELVKYTNENGNKCNHVYGINSDGKEVMFNIDHIIPKSKGGTNHLDNIQIMCFPCNCKKGSTFTNKKVLRFMWIHSQIKKIKQWVHNVEHKMMLLTYSLLKGKHGNRAN
jgi:ABC-type enterochelin transport system substrate-binding protein